MSKKPSKHTPAKPARVRRPPDCKYGMTFHTSEGERMVAMPTARGLYTADEAREASAYLLRAADWIEQQNGGKRGK